MTLILEIPRETETRLRSIAQQRGETLESFTLTELEKLATDTNGAAVSPLRAAIEKIKATPIKSLGPLDAAADLEEVRAGRMEELAG
jgi:hypothetical protein